jgi:ectoine hydroxylase-related dioxygenase (phytanoyl-CoA dioxygenase family)
MPVESKSRLTPRQVEDYQREGFLVLPDPIFPQHKFDALKAHFEKKLAALPSDVRPEAMDVPHFGDTALFEWLLSDDVLDVVEPILGSDIALFSSHFICKPKGNGRRVPWHEDSFYWHTQLNPMEVVTVWLAIDPSKKENGAMQVIPRTFHGNSETEPVDPSANVFPTEIKKEFRNEQNAVTLELEPNHASLHDGRLMHGSPANLSSLRRCGYTMRYIPTSVKVSEASRSWHNVYLARGRDKAGNAYADPAKSYPSLMRYRESHGKNSH